MIRLGFPALFTRHRLFQMIYATALLVAVILAPEVILQLNLSDQKTSVQIRYPGILSTLLKAQLLTVLAMAPGVAFPTHWLIGHRRKCFLPLLPWMVVSCGSFALNFGLHTRAIVHMSSGNQPHSLIHALVIYCGLFGLALEQMLHWIAVHNVMTDGVRTEIVHCPKLWRFL
ncbi:hypothetical protein KR009_007588 [Drosophila setifemur]|nr:hypothetical protein KR009_007588 [Drosophila setifemur]